RRRFDVDPPVLSPGRPATRVARRKVLGAPRLVYTLRSLRRDQVVEADRTQPLEILGQVHVPQRDRLLPCQTKRSEAPAGPRPPPCAAPPHVSEQRTRQRA